MCTIIEIGNPDNLGALLRTIVDKSKKLQPTYAFEIPYSYNTGARKIKEVYRTSVRASTFEEAERLALNKLADQILEWRKHGLDNMVHIHYTPKTQKYD